MTTTRWLDADEQRSWRRFLEAKQRLTDRLDRELRSAHDIGLDDYEVLVHLSESDDGRLRMSELADALLHSRSRLTYRIDRLVRSGLVRRERCPDDKRGTFAVLAEAGAALLVEAAPTHVEGVRTHLVDAMDATEFARLGDVMERIAAPLRDTP
ncbi:MAG: MarR family transcriptional regulator [Actinomycetota bacterium]